MRKMPRSLLRAIGLAAIGILIASALYHPAAAASRLSTAASPYLRSHATDPVDWRQWNDAAFAEARETGKPIYVSIGYLACHWCHVMQEESFRDPMVAALINRHFVPVLVDREERPDIDAQLIRAAALMEMATGWPLNVFITPNGTPFFAGTYFPPTAQRGVPAFSTVLLHVNDLYQQNTADLDDFGKRFAVAFEQSMRGDKSQAVTPDRWLAISQKLLKGVDPFNGGFGTAPKFPQFPAILTLWRNYLRTGNEEAKSAALGSVESMIAGGLYDHLGGGFARYTTDPAWLIPHFEKMLDVNAMALLAATQIWQGTRSAKLDYAVRGTAEFLLREMQLQGGAFATSLDADSEGEEGTFYVWTASELETLLGPDAPLAKQIFGVTPEGNWEGKSILTRQNSAMPELMAKLKIDQSSLLAAEKRIRKTMLAYREKRERPQRDDKILADWNGMVIAALAEAGATFGEPRWVDAARQAFEFVLTTLREGGQLRHSWSDGKVGAVVTLGDYTAMAFAGLTLFEVTGDGLYRDQAITWVKQAEPLWSTDDALYLAAPAAKGTSLPPFKTVEDNASPAGNALIAEVLTRLALGGNMLSKANRPEQMFAPWLSTAESSPRHFGGILNAVDTFLSAEQIVIVGEREEKMTADLIKAVFTTAFPARVFQVIAPGTSLPDTHPAKNKGQINGKATAYVCVGTLCSLPVTSPDELKQVALDMRVVAYESAVRRRSADQSKN